MNKIKHLISLTEYQAQLNKTNDYYEAHNEIFDLVAVSCEDGKDTEFPLSSPFFKPMQKLFDLVIEHTYALAYIDKLEKQLKEKENANET